MNSSEVLRMADLLPIELWHYIFNYLELIDLCSCARVNKAVYLAVKAYRIREIAFTRGVYKWFHFTTITNHKHRVDHSLASILKRSSFNFEHLKCLKIGPGSTIDLDVINRFVHLEELDIDLTYYENVQSHTLSLANLKVIYIFVPDHLSYVELDTPQLAKVRTFSLEMIDIFYPESIRCIHTFCHAGKLSIFSNLEYLTFTDFYDELDHSSCPRTFEELNVEELKNLKEIDFYYHYGSKMNNATDLYETVGTLALSRPDLKVFWFNVQVTCTSLWPELKLAMESVGNRTAFQLRNYEMLKEKVHFFWRYDFNWQMKHLRKAGFNLKSEEFIQKFLSTYSIREIVVIGPVEERELLMDFIANSPDYFTLEFENSDLDQSFFDLMADTVQLNAVPLKVLRLKGIRNGIQNIDFVTRLSDLERFVTDQQLSPEFAWRLFRLPMLSEVEFSSDESVKRIERLTSSRFRLNGKSLCWQKLFKQLETIDLQSIRDRQPSNYLNRHLYINPTYQTRAINRRAPVNTDNTANIANAKFNIGSWQWA